MASRMAYSTWTPQKATLFDGPYLRNRSTLDIGVLGYIGILVVQHKEQSPEVLSIHPGTPCICRRYCGATMSQTAGWWVPAHWGTNPVGNAAVKVRTRATSGNKSSCLARTSHIRQRLSRIRSISQPATHILWNSDNAMPSFPFPRFPLRCGNLLPAMCPSVCP